MRIPRRGFLLGAAALTSSVAKATTAELIPLWPGEPPGGPGPSGPEIVTSSGERREVVRPRLTLWRPDKPNGVAVLVVPGGGYRRVSIVKEGDPTAEWLTSIGVTAFVLTYRLPNAGWPRSAPFQDAQRAMRIIRSRAPALKLDAARVGIIGFSAGGHLSAMTAVRPAAELYPPVDQADSLSARPDFAGLVYPVITFMPPFTTAMTTKTLLGEVPTNEDRLAFSVERLVQPTTPPTFLVHAGDDRTAPAENSLLMASALRAARVPVALHLMQAGGHGFNVALALREAHWWPQLFATWASFA